jgi:endonuclease/exonuclease/phosphatase family metal-dependent hydrolase
MCLEVLALATVITAATTPDSTSAQLTPAVVVTTSESAASTPPEEGAAEVSVLTYNIHGLPWPLAKGRPKALKAIGRELAEMRSEGRQPDIVLIQEGFGGDVAELVKVSGYHYWAQGPDRAVRIHCPPPADGHAYKRGRYINRGERMGKLTGSGLHVLSDAPILGVQEIAYRYCAGLDCLANKGVMMARVALPGVPGEVDVVNTHLNSKSAAGVPWKRSNQAHNLQLEEMRTFISERRTAGAPLLVGGDFNVMNVPERYAPLTKAPYKVVSEFCNAPDSACEGQTADPAGRPWLKVQDLQAFAAGNMDVRPIGVETLFSASTPGGRLSDHDGYLVRYRLSWNQEPAALTSEAPASAAPVLAPHMRTLDLKTPIAY